MMRRREFAALAVTAAFGLTACGSSRSSTSPTTSGSAGAGSGGGTSPSEGTSPSGAPTSASSGGGGKAGGTIAMITVDPSNPYWKAEVQTAVAQIKKLGYTSTVQAHGNDPDKQNQFIDAAISQQVKAIILDPAGAQESVGAVQKATSAGIPVFLVNAEISKQGIARSQIVSNNAQGATLGAQDWAQTVKKGKYVELFGNPTDNNAKVRSDGYKAVLSQYPDLKKVQTEIANWDRAQGKAKMETMLQAHPDIVGVVSGNDEMALGAIQALKEAGKLKTVTVLGFDGSPDAAQAVTDGQMLATVLQPIVEGTTMAVQQADSYIRTGKTGAAAEKQALDCTLVTKKNVGQLHDFTLAAS